jgi:hypothetical protein
MERGGGKGLTWPYYPLFRLDIDERWTLYVDVDTEGEVRIGMMFYAGELFEILAGRAPTTPPEMLHKINQILRKVTG